MSLKIVFDGSGTVCYDNGEFLGECTFVLNDGKWEVNHTFVKKSYEGRGIARLLLGELLDNARKNGVKVIPTCSYAAKVMRNDSYADLL